MDAAALMAIAKLAAFGFLVRMWWVSKKVAEDARAERAARDAAEREAASATAADQGAEPMREAA
ncbi:MAG: hypothetical protein AAF577_01670 [Pseudomonadota bacterium]